MLKIFYNSTSPVKISKIHKFHNNKSILKNKTLKQDLQ